MRINSMRIDELNLEDRDIRARLVHYLAPHESHALFLLGNLMANFPESQLYAAVEGGQWFGVAGYYEAFNAVSLFAERPEASRALIRHTARIHPKIFISAGPNYAPNLPAESFSRWAFS
jgi:hypothetical protein